MEGSEESSPSPWERSLTSMGLPTACVMAENMVGTSAAEELDDYPCGGGGFGGRAHRKNEISLREWLDRPGRPAEMLDCMHVFRQVAETVGLAHSQGVVVTNVRPSCFVMSAFSRVSFIESSSASDSDDDRKGEERAAAAGPGNAAADGDSRKSFPLKRILAMEFNWYTSPEEAAGGPSTFASDIYRLGILLFELFCTCGSLDEKFRTMADLRHRVLPPQLLLKWPKVASFCLLLLHPRPGTRPKLSELLQSELLNETRDSLEEREAAIKLREETEDQELLLEFLLMLRQTKQKTADKLQNTISFLSADIEEAVRQQSVLVKKGIPQSDLYKADDSTILKEDKPMLLHATSDDSTCSRSRKRLRLGFQYSNNDEFKESHDESLELEEHKENYLDGPRFDTQSETNDIILSKSSRMMKNFKNLEASYFSERCRLMKPSKKPINRKLPVSSSYRGSIAGTEGSSVDDLTSKRSHSGWINPFLDGLCKYLSYSKLKVRADLKQGDLLNSSNLVCSLGFDRDQELFATAGINRKIKIFDCDMMLNDDRDVHYPVVEMTSSSKLSSICWNSYIKSQIASSDFEGIVKVWDVTRSQVLMEMREHEKRVWSVDFSISDPTKLASGSDDGTVKLWNIYQAASIGTIRTKANVCSVQFPADSAQSLAIGSADHNVYCYDLRNPRIPWCTLVGHTKTVSYVKFVDSSTLVSASTDNSLKLWDLSTRTVRVHENPLQTFTGHTNMKNFVGLSICDGYIVTGSETNEVFVYHKAFPMPVLSYKFNSEDPISSREVDDASQFISCVCWRGRSSTLIAASSNGDIKLLEMV